MSQRRLNLAALLACLALAAAQAQEELPTDRLLRTLQPTADVNDFAGILTPTQRDALEERCKSLREKAGAQLAVVTLKSLEGGQVDDFAVKLFKRWGIGDKEKKNGILLLVAIQDRKARIEVGYGLEPILPDALAGRILTEQLFPAFRQQRYADGLAAAVNRIAEIIERNEPAPQNVRGRAAKPPAISTAIIFLIVSSLLTALGSFVFGGGLGAKKTNVWVFGSLFLCFAFIMGCAAVLPWSLIIDLPLALILGLIGWRTGRRNPSVFDVQIDNTGRRRCQRRLVKSNFQR
ncbi:MAG: TPM domain-containing protein [Planctomycetia bacterium]|nr:TPM domain-containing protein [Planctomycetia bacterium]